jgi:hypothetical protein
MQRRVDSHLPSTVISPRELHDVVDERDEYGAGSHSCLRARPLAIPVVLAGIGALPVHRVVRERRNPLWDQVGSLFKSLINFLS